MKKTLLWLAALLAVTVLVGCDPEPKDEDEDENPNPALTLVITGINAETVGAAALMPTYVKLKDDKTGFELDQSANPAPPSDARGAMPKAQDSSTTGVFSFKEVVNTTPAPPYKNPGTYIIVLYDKMGTRENPATKKWYYKGNTGGTDPKKYTFNNTKAVIIPFAQFEEYDTN